MLLYVHVKDIGLWWRYIPLTYPVEIWWQIFGFDLYWFFSWIAQVEMHINCKKEAYDRYMDMLLKRAYEAVSEQDDSETETTEDRA